MIYYDFWSHFGGAVVADQSHTVLCPKSQGSSLLRRHLLATASAAVLIGAITYGQSARAEDAGGSGHFTLEIGAGPSFSGGDNTTWFESYGGMPRNIQADTGWELNGKATFQPVDSPWIFDFGVRYGRTGTSKSAIAGAFPTSYGTGTYSAIGTHQEEHTVLDFEAGQDIGLGIFNGGSSIFSGGVRYAHFGTHTSASFITNTKYTYNGRGTGALTRSFSGAGPIVSWDGSTPVFQDSGPFSLDMGLDAAVLFGSQSDRLQISYGDGATTSSERSRSVTVPSFGGYAALSWHFAGPDTKMSLGYRFDSYFNLIDGGFAHPRSIDRIVHGPYFNIGMDLN
jgi:hypothetical protein